MRQTKKNADLRAHQKLFNPPYRIQVIDGAVEVLHCFTFNKPELSVGEVSAATRLHKNTAHRILMALEYNAWSSKIRKPPSILWGIKFFKLGNRPSRGSIRATSPGHI
jgi:DNA-binding IclR family transcriptional regulator